MNNIEIQIESIIEDLSNNKPINSIMLKAQAIAFFLHNDAFSKWVELEQNGYPKISSIPDYRKVSCIVKATLSIPYKGMLQNFDVPVDAIQDKIIREFLSVMKFGSPISEIESLGKSNNGYLQASIPSAFYHKINELFPDSHVETVKQFVGPSAALMIVDKVKSQLLSFFLSLSSQKDFSIDYDVISKKDDIQKILNQTINAAIIHTGTGDITVSNSTITGNQSISSEERKEIMDLIAKLENHIDEDSSEKDEIAQSIVDLKNEIDKEKPSKSLVKKAVRVFYSFSSIIADEGIRIALQRVIEMITI